MHTVTVKSKTWSLIKFDFSFLIDEKQYQELLNRQISSREKQKSVSTQIHHKNELYFNDMGVS